MTDQPYGIEIHYEIAVPDFPERRVTEAIRYVLAHHNIEDKASLSLVVADDERVRALNRQYRDVDAATDVLSFPADPLPDELREEMGDASPYLGDLIVAYPYTVHQAGEAGHALDDELTLLAIHGTLHLLGYDHDTTEHQAKMWAAQSDALKAAGIVIEVPMFTFGDERAN